jgi:REP element-mobilizing transposase RayT
MSATIYRRRLPHIHLAGATYFLTFRLASLQVEPLTSDERDLVVAHIVVMKPGEVRAFVVMPDHVHIVYESAHDERLVATLQALKGVSAHRLVKLGRRRPPIWQGETYDHVVRTEQELLETWRYVEGNPVRRGLAEAPEVYRWSSAWNRA